MTVYGFYSREEGGWLPVATLVNLLAEVGVDEQAVRSSISRLKRRGLLRAERHGGTAGYALSEEARAILREGDERIFHEQRAKLTDGWLLAVFSVPETERDKRHVLRTRLTRLGFGTTAPGVWIAPAHLREPAVAMLRRQGLTGYVELFHCDHLAFGDLRRKVRQWWDLDELRRLYHDFTTTHGPALRRWRRRARPEFAEAFRDYVRVLTDYRRLPYLDPGLPEELLPGNWPGIRAAELFSSLRQRLEAAAREHVRQAVNAAAGRVDQRIAHPVDR